VDLHPSRHPAAYLTERNVSKKHILHFSAGICSFWALVRLIRRYGADNVVVLFADTFIEDDDLYRFLIEALAYAFGAPKLRRLLPLNIPVLDDMDERKKFLIDLGNQIKAAIPQFVHRYDGRSPWELFLDRRFIASGRVDICSEVLKRDLLDAWRKENTTPESAQFYLGFDWEEVNRLLGKMKGEKWKPGMVEIFAPWVVDAPMQWEPQWSKQRMAAELADLDIAVPELYRLGFPHNNCGGFCVKAGFAQFAHLWKTRPHIYDYHERMENVVRTVVGDYSVLKDRRGGGPRRTMTLSQFRARLEAGEDFDRSDWGGICACSANPDHIETEEPKQLTA
jgi:hypothetical protein